MPRKGGKKKKGKVVKPAMQEAVEKKLLTSVNDKLASFGLDKLASTKLEPPVQAAAAS